MANRMMKKVLRASVLVLVASTAEAQWTPQETADLRVVLETMYALTPKVKAEWSRTATDRANASTRMRQISMAIFNANEGLGYLTNAKRGSTREQTVSTGLMYIRQRAVQSLNGAIAAGAAVQAQRDALATIPVRPYLEWRPVNYPGVFDPSGDFDVFADHAYKASESFFNVYWDSVNYSTPAITLVWGLEATTECGQTVSLLNEIGRYIVRARAISIGAPIQGDAGTREALLELLLNAILPRLWDLHAPEFGKNGCIGTLADLNGGEWMREQINWRAPKAIGDPATDNRAAEWFSDLMGMNDIGPWAHAALYPER